MQQAVDPFDRPVDRLVAQGPADSRLAAEEVGEQRHAMSLDAAEEQRGAGLAEDVAGDFRRFHAQIDVGIDRGQLPGSPQFFQKIGQRAMRHGNYYIIGSME